jgi:hypothetical protein
MMIRDRHKNIGSGEMFNARHSVCPKREGYRGSEKKCL